MGGPLLGLLLAAGCCLPAVFGSYRSLMEVGAKHCRNSRYYSEDNVEKIARYCLLVSKEQDCLQYCIYKKLGIQNKAKWNTTRTTELLLEPLLTEFYTPYTRRDDATLDIKYCIEKSLLPKDADIKYSDYCEVAEYVHFCIRDHFPETSRPECYEK